MVYIVVCDVEEWRRDLIVFERPRAAVTALECADLTGRKLEELPLPGPDEPTTRREQKTSSAWIMPSREGGRRSQLG